MSKTFFLMVLLNLVWFPPSICLADDVVATSEEVAPVDLESTSPDVVVPVDQVAAEAEPETVIASTEPQTAGDAVEAAGGLLAAIKTGNWTLVAAFGIMIAVFVVRKLGALSKLPSKYLPWISIGVGVLVAIAAAVIDGQPLVSAALDGVVVGLSGSGLWGAVGKLGLGTKAEAKTESTG